VQLVGGAERRHPTLGDDAAAVGEFRDFRDVVRDHHAGDPERLVDLADEAHGRAQGDGVETGKGFVVEHDERIERHGPGHGHAPVHAARQLARIHGGCAAQSDGLQLEQHQAPDEGFGQLGVFPQRQRHVVETGQIGKERAVLQQHADVAAQVIQFGAAQLVHFGVADPHPARVGAELPRDQLEHRGLAAAARPHHRGDLAGGNRQREVGQHGAIAAPERDTVEADGRLRHRRCGFGKRIGHGLSARLGLFRRNCPGDRGGRSCGIQRSLGPSMSAGSTRRSKVSASR
jgi:hypothetical protein